MEYISFSAYSGAADTLTLSPVLLVNEDWVQSVGLSASCPLSLQLEIMGMTSAYFPLILDTAWPVLGGRERIKSPFALESQKGTGAVQSTES